MLTDTHCHPGDLLKVFPAAEEERRRLGIVCAASSTSREQFEGHEALARRAGEEGAPPVLLCFALHPQIFAAGGEKEAFFPRALDGLEQFAAEGRLDGIGETGFDLYDPSFRATEALQTEFFHVHLEIAVKWGLPLVLHVRRAMDKVFSHTRELRKVPGVIFHSYSGTLGEGESLVKRGINAFFSFGAGIMLNHKEARCCCAALAPERLLLETDAPYQPLRGRAYSAWGDLPAILQGAAALRQGAGNPEGDPAELERITAENFFRAFNRQQF
jgi:TatD DNase family protein